MLRSFSDNTICHIRRDTGFLIVVICLLVSGCTGNKEKPVENENGSPPSPTDSSSNQTVTETTETETSEDDKQANLPIGPDGPDVKLLQSPQGLARYVLLCLQQNNYEAFEKACATEEDMQAALNMYLERSPTDRHEKGREHYKKRTEKFQDGSEEKLRRQTFDAFVEGLEWKNYELDFVSGRPGKNAVTIKPGVVDYYHDLQANLTNDISIQMRQVMKLNGVWKILGDEKYMEALTNFKEGLNQKLPSE